MRILRNQYGGFMLDVHWWSYVMHMHLMSFRVR